VALTNLIARRIYARSLGAPIEVVRRLSSPAKFTDGVIGLDAWRWLRALGWLSDGSSKSLDNIMGVRIGVSGGEYVSANLPANRHDFFYELGRLFNLGPAFRDAADWDYYTRCEQAVRFALVGWRVPVGKARAWLRWKALRACGHLSWTDTPQAREKALLLTRGRRP
jgi:hypothetical protein